MKITINKEIKKIKKKYPKRFNNEEIRGFIESGFSPKDVEEYDTHLSAQEIICLLNNNVYPKEANKYSKSKRFEVDDIHFLVEAGCIIEEAEKYKPRKKYKPQGKDREFEEEIEGLGIASLFKAGFKPEEANEYSSRFSWGEIGALHAAGCTPKQAEKYDLRFDGYDITRLIKYGCSLKKAHTYNKRFTGNDIVHLNLGNVSPEKADKYDSRFSGFEITYLVEEGCPPEKVNKYNKRFHGTDIPYLIESNCAPEEADKYNKRFDGEIIAGLFKHGYTPDKANKYIKLIKLFRQAEFISKGLLPKDAEEYNKTSENYEMVKLIRLGCSPEDVKKYHPRFKGDYISELVEVDCSSEDAKKYHFRFDAEAIAYLINAGCSPEEAGKYDENLNGEKIAILYTLEIKPDNFPLVKQEKLLLLFNRVLEHTEFHLSDVEDAKKFKSLGIGASGMVLLKEDNALKFSKNIYQEYNLLRKIQEYHKGNQRNIIRIKGEPKGRTVLEIEYIKGNSLEDILKKQIPLPQSTIIKYASDIMNGLIEMRQAGVWYHRDIRPANIMIDEINNQAIIIDFGIATTDKKALPQDNRRYGGVNDLVALGQVIYKMTAGEHIFVESKSMERTTHAQKIKDYRDEVYEDETGQMLEKHLRQVDEKIQDEKLKTLIKVCLTSKNYHYKKIKRILFRFSD